MGHNTALAIQSWALYCVGLCLVVSRIAFRLLTLGSFAKLQVDDWLMVFTLIPFTGIIICANKEGTVDDLSTLDASEAVAKLKIRFVLEEMQMVTTWLVKSCLLVLYLRIFPAATSRRERIFLAWIAVYNSVSFLVVQGLLFAWCHPVNNYWSLTPISTQCSTYHNHVIASLVFNITTTIAILLVPIPFIQTPRKFLLGILLALGSLVLSSAILARRYTLIRPTATGYSKWYTVEASVAIIFANLPFLTSLVVSTAPARIRKFSGNVSLTQWPRSYKDTPPLRAERLTSSATSISTLEPTLTKDEKSWNETPPLSPLPQHHRPSDPSIELARFSWSREPSTKPADVEMMPRAQNKLLA